MRKAPLKSNLIRIKLRESRRKLMIAPALERLLTEA